MSSATPKDPEDHGKQLWWMTEEILSLVKKTPFTTVGQIKNTLQEVGVCVSKSTIKRDFTRVNTEGSPQDVNHWVSLKNRKARLEFAKRHLKKAFTVLETTSYGQMRPDQLVPE